MKRAVYGLALLLPLFVVDTINLYPPGRGIPDNVNVYPPITPTTENTNYYPAFPSTGSSLLTDLVAYWNLDELTGTRELTAGSCPACDLSAVNAPSYRGGAGKYAAYVVDGSDQYFSITNSAEMRMNTEHFTYAVWHTITTGAGFSPIIAYGTVSNAPLIDTNTTTNAIRFFCGGSQADVAGPAYTDGVPALITAGYDGSVIWAKAGTAARGTTVEAGGCTAALGNFYVNARADALTTNGTGAIGPVLVWKDRDLSDAEIATLYNSGLGYSCADLPAALRTSLVACWEMDEASGTRVASTAAGASCTTACNLTAVNTPTRVAGHVGNSMGTSANSISTSSQALNLADNASISFGDEDFTVSCWASPTVLGDKIILDKTNEYRLGVDATSKPYAKTGTTDTATAGAATTAGAWILVSGGFDSAGSNTWVSVNGAARVEANETAAPADTAAALRIFSTSAGGSYWDGAVDACGIWGKNVTDATLLALYAAGAGVEYPWSSVASLFMRPQSPWALRSVEEKQAALYARYGVVVPAFMIPSRRVFVR